MADEIRLHTPPKFIQRLREKDGCTGHCIHTRLLQLAEHWDELADGVSTGSDWGPDVLRACAEEVREFVARERGE